MAHAVTGVRTGLGYAVAVGTRTTRSTAPPPSRAWPPTSCSASCGCRCCSPSWPQGGTAAGYDAASVSTFVWLGQGLLAVVLLWGDPELSQRVRTGDVAIDLARPWNLQFALLAGDLGRAGHALLWRFLPPVAFGALLLPFRWPTSPGTLVLFAVAVVLAVALSSTVRFLVELTAFWLLDARGVRSLCGVVGGVLSGLTVPLAFFPDTVRAGGLRHPVPRAVPDPDRRVHRAGTHVGAARAPGGVARGAVAGAQLALAGPPGSWWCRVAEHVYAGSSRSRIRSQLAYPRSFALDVRRARLSCRPSSWW